jgi:hypothetical protein
VSISLYASAEDRVRIIAGLRELADFLEGNPEVPAPPEAGFNVFPPTGLTNAERRAEIDVIASLIGTGTRESAGGHYIASVHFGPVQYSAVAICRDRGR